MIQKRNTFSFEWDKQKNDTNILKHGISFSTAALVFNDKNRVELYDFKHSESEPRYITIGMVNKIITVVYTEKENSIRIISARPATDAERKIYYDNY